MKAIRELEKIAINMPQVCILDPIIAYKPNLSSDEAAGYFELDLKNPISTERCENVFSRHEEMLGEYDFFFEWFNDPTQSDINEFIEKIDEALTPLGCKYTITTKKK